MILEKNGERGLIGFLDILSRARIAYPQYIDTANAHVSVKDVSRQTIRLAIVLLISGLKSTRKLSKLLFYFQSAKVRIYFIPHTSALQFFIRL